MVDALADNAKMIRVRREDGRDLARPGTVTPARRQRPSSPARLY